MYDFEIRLFLERHNYRVSNYEYLYICQSPQINHIKYFPYGDYFKIWTDENEFEFEVYLDEKKENGYE